MTRLTCVAPGDGDGRRLDDLLASWLPGALGRALSRSAIRRLIMAGAVSVDGRPTRRPGMPLRGGARVEARVDPRRLEASSPSETMAAPDVCVLYRDAWLLAVAKPAGLSMHASADPGRPNLFDQVRQWLARGRVAGSGGSPAEPYLGLHHRLDRDTSGVVLFTLDGSANAGLAAGFAARQVEKVYHALTVRPAGRTPRAWRVTAPLRMVGTGRRARMTAAADGAEADTAFALLETLDGALLVEARPATGRRHQVRAHLAGDGLPILGDSRYGGPASVRGHRVDRCMLHAAVLALAHPVTGTPLEIRCPYPDDFRALLDRLGGRLDTATASR